VPEPLQQEPKDGTLYWYLDLDSLDGCYGTEWIGTPDQKRVLARGICHCTKAAALAHFEALIAPSRADAQRADSVEIDAIKEPQWIEWKGGVCPVPDGSDCEIRHRYGGTRRDKTPLSWRWSATPWQENTYQKDADIIAYRVWPVLPKQAEQEKDPLAEITLKGMIGAVRAAGYTVDSPANQPIPTELVNSAPDREQRRFELVKTALHGLITEPITNNAEPLCSAVARHNAVKPKDSADLLSFAACKIADATLAELERTK
jgi:hypothetical protein